MSPSTSWRISPYCTASECVEVGQDPASILVRDTRGTVLAFTPCAWTAFTASLK